VFIYSIKTPILALAYSWCGGETMNEKPDKPVPRPMRPRFGTPAEQKQMDEFRAKLGQALVDNLNRNVLRHEAERPARKLNSRE
jgi:hypothetical protein